MNEGVEHRLNLQLGSVSPHRIRQKEVEFLAEHRGVEARVRMNPRALLFQGFGFQNVVSAYFQSLFMRLDSVVVSGVEEMNQPIAAPQNTAPQIDELRSGNETCPQQVGQLFPS